MAKKKSAKKSNLLAPVLRGIGWLWRLIAKTLGGMVRFIFRSSKELDPAHQRDGIAFFLFILAITLPFDIRDLRYDLAANVKTIPAKIGVKKTIVLAELLLVVFMILKYYQLNLNHISYEQFTATSIAFFITAILIAFSSPKRPELFFSGLIEGTMILMYLAVLIFEY